MTSNKTFITHLSNNACFNVVHSDDAMTLSTEPIDYGFYVEVGAGGLPGRNMLRNAAAQEYPNLKKNIRRYLKAFS